MRIRITQTHILQAGITAVAGQVFDDCPEPEARALIAAGKAEEYQPLGQRIEIPGIHGTWTVEQREPVVEIRDPEPAPVKRGRGRPRRR